MITMYVWEVTRASVLLKSNLMALMFTSHLSLYKFVSFLLCIGNQEDSLSLLEGQIQVSSPYTLINSSGTDYQI